MAFSFENIWLLMLWPIAVTFTIFISLRHKLKSRGKQMLLIGLRSLVLLLLCLAIAGTSVVTTANKASTIFLLDASDSVSKQRGLIEEFTVEAIKHKDRNDSVGVIAFGANASIDASLSEQMSFGRLESNVNPAFTDVEGALSLAHSILPFNEKKRVVIVSDCNENSGNALKQVRLMKNKGITTDVYFVSADTNEDIQVSKISLPSNVNKNEKFDIEVVVNSPKDTKATLKLFSNRQLSVKNEIQLTVGENRFLFTDVAEQGGIVTYSAEIEAVDDRISHNNKVEGYTTVKDVPHVLIIQNRTESAKELVSILRDTLVIDIKYPEQVPDTLDELVKYDAFVLANISAEQLSDDFIENLENVIKHQGKGLLVTGGDQSYALGGYMMTPLETVLPVKMDIKQKEEEPNLGLVLVIDKSGSMGVGNYGVSKVELAKEAAIRSTEILSDKDYLGIIAFDDAVKWVLKTEKMIDKKKAQNAIGTIRAGGGTQIVPSLEEAYLSLKETDAKLKHIILLTDGQAERSGYERVIKDIREADITVSTVAVGTEADIMLMKALAYAGNGRYYETDETTDIPKIFAKETFLAGKKYLNNLTFMPEYTSFSDILKGIDAIPELDGYVASTPKDTARVILKSPESDPILSSWQYGLGRTVAWTSDVQGIWTNKWMQWGSSSAFWKNIMSWIIQKNINEGYMIESRAEAGNGSITVTIQDPEKYGTSIKGVLINPLGEKEELELRTEAPGKYSGAFSYVQSGVYLADLIVEGLQGDVGSYSISTATAVPYSPEYDIRLKGDEAFALRLVNAGGGRLLSSPKDVFKGELSEVKDAVDMTIPLLIIALLLLMLDITLRRLNIRWKVLLNSLRIKSQPGVDFVMLGLSGFKNRLSSISDTDKKLSQKTRMEQDKKKFQGNNKIIDEKSSQELQALSRLERREKKIMDTHNSMNKGTNKDNNKGDNSSSISHLDILLREKKRNEQK